MNPYLCQGLIFIVRFGAQINTTCGAISRVFGNIVLFRKTQRASRLGCPLCFGGGRGIRTPVGLPPNGFQDFREYPKLPQNKRKYQTIENAENPDVARVFGVLSFPKTETSDNARISVSKTISKTFLEKLLDKSAQNSPVASHDSSAKSATTD